MTLVIILIFNSYVREYKKVFNYDTVLRRLATL